MRLLIQRTIDTGQERVARLLEVEPTILAQFGLLLREAIKSGQRVHVGAGWWCRAAVEQKRLEAELLPWASGPALVSMTVTPEPVSEKCAKRQGFWGRGRGSESKDGSIRRSREQNTYNSARCSTVNQNERHWA